MSDTPLLRRRLALLTTVAWIASSSAGAASTKLSEEDCVALAGDTISATDISLPTTGASVTSAGVSADSADSNYCKVNASIRPVDHAAPSIEMQLSLPLTWNGKALHLGGAAYNGQILDALNVKWPRPVGRSAISQGYATFASDSGHSSSFFSAAFALNDEALENYAGAQLKKTRDAAILLIELAYGIRPRRMYFAGASQGGHEAFTVVQRWPQDYDGAIAVFPAFNFTAQKVGGTLTAQSIYKTPGGWLSPSKARLLADSVYAACDDLDGLKDGVIANVAACNGKFRLDELRCRGGRDTGDNCLSDAQLMIVRKIASPVRLGVSLSSGDTLPQWPVLEGGRSEGAFSFFGGEKKAPRPSEIGEKAAYPLRMGDQTVRFIILRDPNADSLNFDPRLHAARLTQVSFMLDTVNPDISAFERRHGKLLILHGTVDMLVSPHNTIAYFESMKSHFGVARLRRFVRFYLAPGYGHSDGPFQIGWDALGTLDAWADRGVAPALQTVIDTAQDTAGRSMPLCEYPEYPRFMGRGDPKAATSFNCVNSGRP